MKKKVDVLITGTYEIDERDLEGLTFAKQLAKDKKLDADSIVGIMGTIKMTLSWADSE